MPRAVGIMFQGKAFRKGPVGFELQKVDLCVCRSVGEGRGRRDSMLQINCTWHAWCVEGSLSLLCCRQEQSC